MPPPECQANPLRSCLAVGIGKVVQEKLQLPCLPIIAILPPGLGVSSDRTVIEMGKLVEKAQLNNVHAWVEQQGLSVELRRHFPAVTGKAVDHLPLQRAVELRPQHTSQEEEEEENTQHGPPEYTAHRFPVLVCSSRKYHQRAAHRWGRSTDHSFPFF